MADCRRCHISIEGRAGLGITYARTSRLESWFLKPGVVGGRAIHFESDSEAVDSGADGGGAGG